MQRLLLVAILLVGAVAGLIWLFSASDTVPPPPPVAVEKEGPGTATVESATGIATGEMMGRHSQRESVVAATGTLLDDAEIRSSLTGFKGRVVTHANLPVGDVGVRIYRGAMDTILPDGVDIFADVPTAIPQYVAGESRTAQDGTFLIEGVWPRAFYIMFAGIGSDAPMHQILSRTPAPGEVVDLGDVVLPDAGVITGVVVDEDDEPLPDALVRAADLPGAVTAFFPIERFDPTGALLIREPQSPFRVVEMPAWVKDAFEHLPIPSVRTAADGHFRLVGVIPGSNMLATTKVAYLSDVKPSVQIRAGQVRDVGKIKLKRGEELAGRVLDGAGKPVAAAEVLAGSTLTVAPVDLAQRLGKADADGRFTGMGFAPGKVTVAARRGPGHAWVLAEPQSIIGDVVVTLPTAFAVDVTLTLADGKPAKVARMRLLQGQVGDGAAEMAVFGMVPPIDLRDRQKVVDEGRWRIENLHPGHYSLVADAPGHATGFAKFELTNADAAVQVQLPAKIEFVVRVQSHESKPVRNATIYAEASTKNVMDMPVNCGRTDATGKLVIDKVHGDSLRVSATHPRWGVVHGEAKYGEELVLVMQMPGSIRGLVTDNGRPPKLGEFSVAVEGPRGGTRGPFEQVPVLLTPGVDGTFVAAALQPGRYHVVAFKSLETLRSPGGVFGMMQEMYMMRNTPNETIEVVAGQVASVQLEVGEKPIEGPTAHLFGSVTIDGKLAAGSSLIAHGQERRFHAKVDQSGRFDFGQVPATELSVTLMGGAGDALFGGGMGNNLWSSSIKLTSAEEREVTITVVTSSIAGMCVLPDGSPAAGVHVMAQGRLKNDDKNEGSVWMGSATDAQGRFQFSQVAEGTYSLNVRSGGENAARGKVEGIVVLGGVPVDTLRIDLSKALVVKGRVDMTPLGNKKLQWCWLAVHTMPKDGGTGVGDHVDGIGIDSSNGNFSTDDLAPGRYRLRLHVSFDENKETNYSCGDIDVPAEGLQGIVLTPVKEQ